jgi:IMP dehydrogenase/GMP reductase
MTKTALTYDDIQLVPSYSDIESRSAINLNTQLSKNYKLKIPLMASPMDTVCENEMAIAMAHLGGVGCIHRFMTIPAQQDEVKRVSSNLNSVYPLHAQTPIMAAIGANGDYLERAQELVKVGANVILIDVAHGHHTYVKTAIEQLKKTLPSHVDIIAGNVATAQGAQDLESWGADAIRVGIGGGSLCSTRVKTGFGVPNITSLEDAARAVNVPVIACGGIRSSGDIAKALAVGASSVILGSLLAGTKEAPGQIIENASGLYKRYRGAASLETKITHNQHQRNVEGESTVVPFKGGVKFIIEGLEDGIRSALSYAGARSLSEFAPEYVMVTNAGMNEAKPHLL